MERKSSIEKASAFRRLHDRSRILVLPNAWDAASARIFADAGAAAIGTSSGGVAAALGYPDGEKVSRGEMAEAVRRIARTVSVPVSADMEAGYGRGPGAVAETVRAAIMAGAVGINLEDGSGGGPSPLTDLSLQIERLQAAREAAAAAGVEIVINARTDVFLLAVGEECDRLDHAVRRANAYREAGADCLFVPGVRDRETIAALVRRINGPINLLVAPGTPTVPELEQLGVARVSVGSGPMRATLALVRRIAQELLGAGTYAAFTEDAIPYAEVNRMLSG